MRRRFILKSLYLRNLFLDLYRNRIKVLCFVVVCTVAFAFLGYKKASPETFLTEEEKLELEEYNAKIEEYEEALKNFQESLELARTQAKEQQRYIDNSIYMKLDSQNIQVASAQYSVETGGNVGNILSALVFYINEGGLKESLPEEYGNLDINYWREIVACGTSGNVLNLTIIHYNAEQVQKIFEIADQRIMAYVPEVIKTHGEFKLTKIESSLYTKADGGVTGTQNNHLNTLKGYLTNVGDFENRIVSQKTTIENYIEKNAPSFSEAVAEKGSVKDIIKYALVGFIFGIVLPCLWFALRYVLDNRVRSKEDLIESQLNVLGSYCAKATEQKDLERCKIGVQLLAKQQNISSIFLDILSDDDLSKTVTDDYEKAIIQDGITVKSGCHVYEDGKELQDMVSSKTAVFIVQAGKTTYNQLEQHMILCRRFSVDILGCIVIE